MPIRINEIWRVTWWQPNNGIIRVLLVPGRNGDDPLKEPQYVLCNLDRDYGEPRLGETYRFSLMPAFPTDAGTDRG